MIVRPTFASTNLSPTPKLTEGLKSGRAQVGPELVWWFFVGEIGTCTAKSKT